MSRATFNDLPNEILSAIVKTLAVELEPRNDLHALRLATNRIGTRPTDEQMSLHALRLVSKRIGTIAHPYAFSELRIHPFAQPYSIPQYTEILTALADRSTNAYALTESLVISLCTNEESYLASTVRAEILNALEQHLVPAVANLQNLRSVMWIYFPHADPLPLAMSFVKCISSIPTLRVLSLSILCSPDLDFLTAGFSLSPLSNLTTIQFSWIQKDPRHPWVKELRALLSRCPSLENLWLRVLTAMVPRVHLMEILTPEQSPPLRLRTLSLEGIQVTLEDFTRNVRHFRHLKCLEISRNLAASFGQNCAVLQRAGINLESCSSDVNDPLFLDYISSYSGVHAMKISTGYALEDIRNPVNRFFCATLPKHSGSLKRLKLKCFREIASWSVLTSDQLEGLFKCQELRELQVQRIVNDTHLLSQICKEVNFWLETALKLSKLTVLRFKYYYSIDLTHAQIEYCRSTIEETISHFKEMHNIHFHIRL